MKNILFIVVFLHGLIHIGGFAVAFNLIGISSFSMPISRIKGLFWLFAGLLFWIGGELLFLEVSYWWLFFILAILISQYQIFTYWKGAKMGTLINFVLVFTTISGYAAWHFHNTYKNEVEALLRKESKAIDPVLTEPDIEHLPNPVKKYLRVTGSMGKPRVKNFGVVFEGQIRKDEKSGWMPFHSVQYNFMDASARLFYMKATMWELPVTGFHSFRNGTAFMDIRLLSLFKVEYQSGQEMGLAETVTFFNDMCCMAPATLIDKRVKWLEVNGNTVKVEFVNNKISIVAWLYFSDNGELINFISDDRYALTAGSMERLRWSTPIQDYVEIKGNRLAGYARVIYRYPAGDFCYGIFQLQDIEYNCKHFKK
jgi:hypothetical protein